MQAEPSPRPSVLTSFSWLSAGLLASRVLQFAVTVYLTRVLGTQAFGRFSFVIAFLWFGVIATDFGLSTIATRELARNARRLRTLGSLVMVLRLAVFAVEMALIVSLPWLLGADTELYWLFVYSFLTLLAYAINTDWIFRGFERMEYVAIWEVVPRLIWLGGIIAFVRGPEDLLKVPLLRLAGEVLTTAALLAAAWWRYPASRLNVSALHPLNVKILVKQAAPIGVAALLAQVYYNFDQILLGILKDDATVGWYSAAYRVVTLLLSGTFLLAATYQPVLARLLATDREAFARHVRRLSAAALLLGVVPPVIVAAGALPIVRVLYGREFDPAAGPLALLMASMPLAYLGVAYTTILVAAGKQARMMVATAAGAAANVVGNLLLIPPLGMTGAAIATLVAYGVAWSLQWWYVRRQVCPVELLPLAAVAETLQDLPGLLRRR